MGGLRKGTSEDGTELGIYEARERGEGVSERRREGATERGRGSREDRGGKSKGMHWHVRERLPVSKGVEVKALDLPHSCSECERTFPTTRGLAVHRARWCRPGQRPASRWGQLLPMGPAR